MLLECTQLKPWGADSLRLLRWIQTAVGHGWCLRLAESLEEHWAELQNMSHHDIWWHLVTPKKVIHYGIFAIYLFFFLQVFKFRVFVAKYASFFGESNKWIMLIWSFLSANLGTFRVLSAVPQIPSRLSCSRISLQLQQLGIYLLQNLLDAWQKGGDMVTKKSE